MTNIYFWGKVISPTFHNLPSKPTASLISIHTQEVIKTVESGAENAFLLTDSNQLYAIGSNQDGQMGLSFNPHKQLELSRVFVPTKNKIVSVSCGWFHALILDQLGCLFSSGKGSQGATGQNTRQNSYGFKQIMTGVRKASAGLDHSLAIKGNKVYGWGNSSDGQLGMHSKKLILAPKQLTVYPCNEVFAGAKYSIFVTIKGVYGCGINNNFQLGLGHDKNVHYPKNLEINDQIIKIWGGNYCFAKNQNQEMYIWGSGAFGVFRYPTKIQFFTSCDHMSLGLNFGIVEKNQRIYVWGSNNFGQLGNCSTQNKDYAYESSNLSSLDLALFSCGKNFTIGISYGEPKQLIEKKRMKTEFAQDQVIEQFYGDESFEDKQNKFFMQSAYSSCDNNPKRTQHANIFNQSVKSNQNNNFIASNLKNSNKINMLGQNSVKSEKDQSISDQTVKRMTKGLLKNLNMSRQRSQKYSGRDDQIQKFAEQLSELKDLIQEKSRRNYELDGQNILLKQFIKESLLKENDRSLNNSTKFSVQDLKGQYHSINEIVERSPYLKNLLESSHFSKSNKISHNQHQVDQIESFGSKLNGLKLVLEEIVQNTESARNSSCQ